MRRRRYQGCEDLTKVTLGKGLKVLPAFLFKGCAKLFTRRNCGKKVELKAIK